MKDNNDLLIASFFEQYGKKEIADNGFSQRVMNALPHRERSYAKLLNTLWTCFCGIAAISLFLFADGINFISSVAINVLNSLLAHISAIDITLSTVIMTVVAIYTLLICAVYNIISNDDIDYSMTISK